MNPVSQPFGPCPCGEPDCDMQGTILLKKTGHLRGCGCTPCRNAGNHKAGHRSQDRTHAKLGGRGRAPTNEASARPYVAEIAVMPESKTGDQLPASWRKFIASDWFRHAIAQADRAVPVGSGVVPAVSIDNRYLVVDLGEQKRVRRG